jgi:hypothetical protein
MSPTYELATFLMGSDCELDPQEIMLFSRKPPARYPELKWVRVMSTIGPDNR